MSWFTDFIELLFPLVCCACGKPLNKGEQTICTICYSELPLTNYHLYDDNPVAQLFWGRIPIEAATSLIYFHKKGRTQQLLHNLKYKQRKDVGILMGHILGNQLLTHKKFSTIDVIIPIPLHPRRLKQRGYNQAECFAQGISEVLNKPVETSLIIRTKETSTQTKKSRVERWENVSEAFTLMNPELWENKHFLIVDDVLTTGATIEACAQVLLTIPHTKISVATIAKA